MVDHNTWPRYAIFGELIPFTTMDVNDARQLWIEPVNVTSKRM